MTQKTSETLRAYKMIRKIGSGATSEVWQVTKEGQDFAMKVFKKLEDISEQKICMQNEKMYAS